MFKNLSEEEISIVKFTQKFYDSNNSYQNWQFQKRAFSSNFKSYQTIKNIRQRMKLFMKLLKANLLFRENLDVLEFHQQKFNNIERRLKIV